MNQKTKYDNNNDAGAMMNCSCVTKPLAGGFRPAPEALGLIAFFIIIHKYMAKKSTPICLIGTPSNGDTFPDSFSRTSGKKAEKRTKTHDKILIAGNAIIHYSLASGKRMHFNKPIY